MSISDSYVFRSIRPIEVPSHGSRPMQN